jgi:hypothetical protein
VPISPTNGQAYWDRVLAISGGDDDYTQITVPNFHPDQFTTTSEWK